uniref:NACHT domain-containing protein n=1 Tax=Oryzias latipes TaxID=8090 RepID=A0A3B3I3R5_ORYLA
MIRVSLELPTDCFDCCSLTFLLRVHRQKKRSGPQSAERPRAGESEPDHLLMDSSGNTHEGAFFSALSADVGLQEMFGEHQISLRSRSEHVAEGTEEAGRETLLNRVYTELYITEGLRPEGHTQHEVMQSIRVVLTSGVAGAGKSFSVQKFTLDWAEGLENQDISAVVPLSFREMNLIRDEQHSLLSLIQLFHPTLQKIPAEQLSVCKLLFIFDGLDESRLSLDFNNSPLVSDVTHKSSVNVLLTNLIQGRLLPSALVWITSRPAAANQIPPSCVDRLTEVRGFNDAQKEEYFRRRFPDEELSSRIISHIKGSMSLYIMCEVPVFCWITAVVLENLLTTEQRGELPESRKMMESLGKLAFEQLQKGNLIFYESDLTECGIDIRAASVYSGVFTQIFREERGLYQDKVFCFIHLSVQEFLAALHVHRTFITSGLNLMEEERSQKKRSLMTLKLKQSPVQFYQSAVEKALQSPNGHLDLFLRFFLGLSLRTNQNLLRGLLTQTGSSSQTNQETVQFIKEKISEDLSAEKSINLFHCLNELNDGSLVEEIQQFLRSGRLSTDKLSPAQWSALAFILLSSEDLEEFDLQKYSGSEEALLRLLPVIKASNKALISALCSSKQKDHKILFSLCLFDSVKDTLIRMTVSRFSHSFIKRT